VDVGLALRNMGEAATTAVLRAGARDAEQAGLESLWVADHVAIPPDDAEGSGGRYLDPLATLAFLAAATQRIRLGTGVLVLPYRRALPTAKQVATIQELSGGRLLLGVGAGWMEAEFRALGIDRRRRGADTDAVLDLLDRAFAADDDVVEANGQPFLFRPRPPRPPVYVGGAPGPAFPRILRWGDGWMPIARSAESLARHASELRRRAREAGRPEPEVVGLGGLPLEDRGRAGAQLGALREAGLTRFVHGGRYADESELRRAVEALARVAEAP